MFMLYSIGPSSISGGFCLPNNLGMDDRYIPSSRDHVIKFEAVSGEVSEKWEIESAFFKDHVKSAAYLCYVRSYFQMHKL